MKLLVPFVLLLACCLGLSGCAGIQTSSLSKPIDYSPADSVTRAEALRIAESYRVHNWRATEANVLHGDDDDGIRVDTPDYRFDPPQEMESRPGWWVPGKTNVGIPYQWGGFDTPPEFDRKLAAGNYAGDIYTEQKRTLLDNAVSVHACGIYCSGFISRCWRLERSYSTRELAGLCEELSDFSDIQSGDLVNKTNVHALLFVEWVDRKKTRFVADETGSPPTWKVLRHPISVEYVRGLGYRPYRYRGMRD